VRERRCWRQERGEGGGGEVVRGGILVIDLFWLAIVYMALGWWGRRGCLYRVAKRLFL
jgi:hypothetical protein